MTLRLNGSTSGYTEIDAPAVAGNNNITLPSGNGSANQFLKNGTTPGTLGWSSMVQDSSGRLLVGTSSSSALGTVFIQGNSDSATNAGYITLQRGEAAGASIVSGALLGVIQFCDSSANIFAQIYAEGDANSGTNDYPGRLVFRTTADGASSPTERMRITSGGSTYFLATAEPSASVGGAGVLSVSGGALIRISRTGTSSQGVMDFFNSNGGVGSITTSGSSTAFNTSSDYRLKENVAAVTDGITRLQQLKPSRFNFIADPDKTVDGFIAHEVQTVVPEAITGTKDETDADGTPIYQGIDQSKLVPLLTAALQEAVAKIEALEARIAALEVTP